MNSSFTARLLCCTHHFAFKTAHAVHLIQLSIALNGSGYKCLSEAQDLHKLKFLDLAFFYARTSRTVLRHCFAFFCSMAEVDW
jgi:hypothetical protein